MGGRGSSSATSKQAIKDTSVSGFISFLKKEKQNGKFPTGLATRDNDVIANYLEAFASVFGYSGEQIEYIYSKFDNGVPKVSSSSLTYPSNRGEHWRYVRLRMGNSTKNVHFPVTNDKRRNQLIQAGAERIAFEQWWKTGQNR